MSEIPTTISAPRRGWPVRLMSVVAVAFGLLTLKEGGAVLLGSEAARAAAGNIVPFVLWFNFMAGFAYVAAGVGLWPGKRWATRLAMVIALANLAVLGSAGHSYRAGAGLGEADPGGHAAAHGYLAGHCRFGLAHIGIGGSHYRLRPCHTTRHAGPHRAVREFEVMTDVALPADRSTQWSARCLMQLRHCCATSDGSCPPLVWLHLAMPPVP